MPKNGLIFIVKRSLDWSKTRFVLHVCALSASVFPCCECKIRDLFASIWGAFCCHFGVMGPSGAPVVSFPPKVGKITSTWGPFGRPLDSFGRLLGSIWAALGCHCDPSVAKMAPTSVQNLEKSRSKHALRYRICFCIDFLPTFVPRPGAPNHPNHGNLARFTVFQRLKRFPL